MMTKENETVSLEALADLTGFPESFIKDELSLASEEISLELLRESVLKYLDEL